VSLVIFYLDFEYAVILW